jgi:rifampicin phosphotransferase
MRGADESHDPSVQRLRLSDQRQETVTAVRERLGRVDRLLFDRALRATTVYSQGRERSKTTVVRAIHGVRLAQRELARRAAERGGPADPTDACLLTIDELRAFVADPTPFAERIAERRGRYEQLASLVPPFIIEGTVPPLSSWAPRGGPVTGVAAGERLRGIPGCPGMARGRARVVLDPGDPGALGPGDVLIAPITDPSWTPLFLAAEAVVVDVGAVMSHAVIVSRELGIPCVVSATDATRRIPDGALVEVDGDTGTVTVVDLP